MTHKMHPLLWICMYLIAFKGCPPQPEAPLFHQDQGSCCFLSFFWRFFVRSKRMPWSHTGKLASPLCHVFPRASLRSQFFVLVGATLAGAGLLQCVRRPHSTHDCRLSSARASSTSWWYWAQKPIPLADQQEGQGCGLCCCIAILSFSNFIIGKFFRCLGRPIDRPSTDVPTEGMYRKVISIPGEGSFSHFPRYHVIHDHSIVFRSVINLNIPNAYIILFARTHIRCVSVRLFDARRDEYG